MTVTADIPFFKDPFNRFILIFAAIGFATGDTFYLRLATEALIFGGLALAILLHAPWWVCLLVATCLVLRDHLWALLAVTLACAVLASDRVLAVVGLAALLLAVRVALTRAEVAAAEPERPEEDGGEEKEEEEDGEEPEDKDA